MIKKGDLVMIVRGCCDAQLGKRFALGRVFEVGGIAIHPDCVCPFCGFTGNGLMFADAKEPIPERLVYAPIPWLRKIDPPSEGETREAYVNLKQPRKVTA